MKESKIPLVAVSYLNTLPFIYGIEKFSDELNVHLDIQVPAQCAQNLMNGNAKIGLIPVAAIRHLKNYQLISDYCIGAYGEVKSVLLFSEVPLKEIKTILLDYQSATSVQLVQLLAKFHWHISPEFLPANPGFEKEINKNTAAVVIGDRTFAMFNQFPYRYDLAKEWFELTNLPFVFAAWVSTEPLTADFTKKFNEIIGIGVQNIEKVISFYQHKIAPEINALDYFKNCISYPLDEQKKKALAIFLNYLETGTLDLKAKLN